MGSISLPFADPARSELVGTLVALGQTLALVGLLAVWGVLVVRPMLIGRPSQARHLEAGASRTPLPAAHASDNA